MHIIYFRMAIKISWAGAEQGAAHALEMARSEGEY